jgi:hypothetical protein
MGHDGKHTMRLSLTFALLLLPGALFAQPVAALISTGEPAWPDGSIGQVTPVDGVRPASVGMLRSVRVPVVVHVGAGVDANLATRALAYSEHALNELEFHHGFDAPLPDGDHGGSPSLDVYLTADGPSLETVVDTLDATHIWDRASAFVRVRANHPSTLQRSITEGIGRAIVLGAKADHPPLYVIAMGNMLARLVTHEAPDVNALRAFQAEPHRAMFGGDLRSESYARGASLFFDFVAARYDSDDHRMLKGLMMAPVQHTPTGWVRLWNEPDFFDIARRMFRAETDRLEGGLTDFAVARTTLGTAADPVQLAETVDNTLGVRPVTTLQYQTLPQRAFSREPLEPTGMSVVMVDLADAPVHAAMAAWFHGSPWQRWMIRVVRVGSEGRTASDLLSPVIANGEWSCQLDVLDGFTSVMFVIVNLGDLTYEPDAPQNANGFFVLNVDRAR